MCHQPVPDQESFDVVSDGDVDVDFKVGTEAPSL
jgi:hypothetical protein